MKKRRLLNVTPEKILIAMSGGVDSAVTALLLKDRGYDCVGATMKLTPPEATLTPTTKSCCNPEEIVQAKQIATMLGIPHYVLDLSNAFCRHVVDYFVKTYLCGGTPNPCVECNRTMKFGKLMEKAAELNCTKMATGHYASIVQDPGGRWLLKCAKDPSKDQTYVLWSLNQNQLSRTVFPLGDLTKAEVREIAAQNGFVNAYKKDSQDICFVPDGDYAAFLERYTQKSFPEGDFVGLDGQILGRHKGVVRYTIGQRKGLGIAFGTPTYVVDKSAKENKVVLGSNKDLFRRELTANHINLIATDCISSPIRVQAKVRYRASAAWATAEQIDDHRLHLIFDEAQRAISPGQSVVLYDGETVVGGGIIE